MNNLDRPPPEEFLETANLEERQRHKGRLKIFLGMAAGVGKTYAMLTEAQELKNEGVDVRIGVVDTHGRQETAALVLGLKAVSPRVVLYKDHPFEEMDVDGIIHLHPELVLVDELAHNNTPGSKHAKRWQDVMDILDSGINVYSTLNVQHIESLNDIVKGITGVSVHETVPDHIVEKASSIQLVDLTPDELLQRLKEGKVYLGDQSQVAILNFFQKNRLTALREIVLRYAADKIDQDLRTMIPKKEGVIDWKPRDKFLVAVSHSPHTQKLIRSTRRLAAQLNAPWIAVHVDDGKLLSAVDQERLSKNLSLAHELGADVVTIFDISIADGIKRVSDQRGVTQIILGRPPADSIIDRLKGYPLLTRLTRECKNVDIHIISHEKNSVFYRKPISWRSFHKKLSDYFIVFLYICAVFAIGWFAQTLMSYKLIGVLFLLAIFGLSIFFKTGPIIFASVAFALIWDFFFIPPVGSFSIGSNEDIVFILLYMLTGITVGVIIDRAKEQKEMLIKSEKSTYALYDIVRILANNSSAESAIKAVKERLRRLFKGAFEILIKQYDGTLPLNDAERLLINDKERNAAIWSFENGKEAGRSTNTLPYAENLYIPLQGLYEVVGLLIFRPENDAIISVEEKNLLDNVCQQLAHYLDRSITSQKEHDRAQFNLVEETHNMILKRFYQAFEAPIVTTRGAIDRLKDQLTSMNAGSGITELVSIEQCFETFSKFLTNITAMSQLSEGMVPLHKEKHNIREMLEEYCSNPLNNPKNHRIKVKVDKALPPVAFDYYLMRILLHNLILNAIEHSPLGSTIQVEAKKSNGFMILSVSDEGKGIPEAQLDAIFEKFYRLPHETSPGIGLGLAIAKTIAEIHGAILKVENLPDKGAKFTLILPIA